MATVEWLKGQRAENMAGEQVDLFLATKTHVHIGLQELVSRRIASILTGSYRSDRDNPNRTS